MLFPQVTSLTRKLEELQDKLAESESLHERTKVKLETMAKSKYDLDYAKQSLETQLEEKKQQIEELDNELQSMTDDANRSMQAMKTQFERELAALGEFNEETREQVTTFHFNIE